MTDWQDTGENFSTRHRRQLAVKQVQDDADHYAQDDAAHDGDIEATVFAFDKNVAGQMP